jgi:hypothetical protein
MVKIPALIKKGAPKMAEFCELVNFSLQGNPNMSLAEFAEQLSRVNVDKACEILLTAEIKQIYGGERHEQN